MTRDIVIGFMVGVLAIEALAWSPYVAEAMVRRAFRRHGDGVGCQRRALARLRRFRDRGMTMFALALLTVCGVRVVAADARRLAWYADDELRLPDVARLGLVGAAFGGQFGLALVLMAMFASGLSVRTLVPGIEILAWSAALLGGLFGVVGIVWLGCDRVRRRFRRTVTGYAS